MSVPRSPAISRKPDRRFARASEDLRERLDAVQAAVRRCGLLVIDVRNGDIVHWYLNAHEGSEDYDTGFAKTLFFAPYEYYSDRIFLGCSVCIA
jgi:hypothetical protein